METRGREPAARGLGTSGAKPISTRLLILVLVAVLPIILFSSVLIYRTLESEEADQREQLESQASALTEAVDRELGIHRAIVKTLHHTPALQRRDWPAFREQIRDLTADYPWARVIVIDASGQILFSSSTPDGEPLPTANGTAAIRRALATGDPQISDYFIGAVSHQPSISTYLPMTMQDGSAAVLALSCNLGRFQDIVSMLPGAQAAIIDTRNIFIARAQDPEIYVGHAGPQGLFDHAQSVDEGLISIIEVDQVRTRVAYVHSKMSNWIIAVGAEENHLIGRRNRLLLLLGGGGALLLGLSLLGALWYGGRIAAQAARLSSRASALGTGAPMPPRHFDIGELEHVANAVDAAAAQLARQNRDRQAIQDQLEQRVAERTAELSASEGRYRLLAENSMDIIVRGNLDGIRDYVSPACYRLFGYRTDELLGLAIDSSMHPDDVGKVHQVLDRLREEQNDILATFRMRRKNGDYVWCEVAFRLFREREGEAPTGFLATFRDITLRKMAEERAVAAMNEANRANRTKSLFLASMSHELRTPLNAIIGFAEMLQGEFKGALNPAQAEYVGYILRSGNLLLMQVQDLLSFASLDAAPLQIKLEPVDLDTVLDEIEPTIGQMARSKSVGLSIARVGSDAPRLLSNHHRLAQVLTNLCSNAIKYNRPGGSVEISADFSAAGSVGVTVSDTGIGIAHDRHDALFEPFNRLGAEAGAIEGTGIGLSICKRLTDAMGGRIVFSSESGAGSRFTVILPTADAGADAREANAGRRLDKIRP